ncbi:DNA-binding domain-containing protein [Marinifilum fragile]|uniref:DNA-binding domain-containing protein n=1 Tax=Marinifilum fragile TaxID=570161 RepID=UPI002AABE489|nr:DNA-binding domain-containing protein [Marinifilum fragile]
MTLPFYLRKNPLTQREDDFSAQTLVFETTEMEAIVSRAVKRHSSLNEVDATLAVNAVFEQVYEELLAGNNVITPMCNIRLSIAGVFDADHMDFDPEYHKVNLNFTPGVNFRNLTQEVKLKKITASDVLPKIDGFEDSETASKNEKITPGKGGIVKGSKLKLNKDKAEEGLFFIAADNTEHKVTTYMRNMPSELIFSIPDGLTAGKYRLEIRTYLEGKTLRTGQLDYELTVD